MDEDWTELLGDSREPESALYIRTDEREDVITSLEHFARTCKELRTNPHEWKWALISLHLCVQGTLVCVLSGTNGFGALSASSLRKWQEWYERRGKGMTKAPPRETLADTRSLFERSRAPEYMGEFGGQPIQITAEQGDSFERLMELRNGFSHFSRKGWSIELLGLPRIAMDILSVIEMLQRHPAFDLRVERGQRKRCSAAIDAARMELQALDQDYSDEASKA